jgi:hypothetical protein
MYNRINELCDAVNEPIDQQGVSKRTLQYYSVAGITKTFNLKTNKLSVTTVTTVTTMRDSHGNHTS